jgi:hypothetical protein
VEHWETFAIIYFCSWPAPYRSSIPIDLRGRHLVKLNGDLVSVEAHKLLSEVPAGSEYFRLESLLNLRTETFEMEDGTRGEHYPSAPRYRFANKVLARLYTSRMFTAGMVFRRGCFLGDTTRMVNGDLVSDAKDVCENVTRKFLNSCM